VVIFAKFNSQIYLIGLFGVKFWLILSNRNDKNYDCAFNS